MEQLKAKASALGIGVGTDLIPKLTSAVNWLDKHRSTTKALIGVTGGLISALVGFKVLSVVVRGFKDARTALGLFSTAAKRLAGSRLGTQIADSVAGPVSRLGPQMQTAGRNAGAQAAAGMGAGVSGKLEGGARPTPRPLHAGVRWRVQGNRGPDRDHDGGRDRRAALPGRFKKLRARTPDSKVASDMLRGEVDWWENMKTLPGLLNPFREGGLVPSLVSPGEQVLFGSRSWTVPGIPTAADSVLAALPSGAAVMTWDGQARLAAGLSLPDAIASQAPHFQSGGTVPIPGMRRIGEPPRPRATQPAATQPETPERQRREAPPRRVPGTNFLSTAYGPPWVGIQGTGVTATGVNLKNAPHVYGVAVDPGQIKLGSSVFAWPNPFGYTGAFRAFDTGGAIKGRRLDFYDWRGRDHQNRWGRRNVTVSGRRQHQAGNTFRETGGGGRPVSVDMLRKSGGRGGLLGDAFSQGMDIGRQGITRAALAATRNPVLDAIREALRGAGTQPDRATRAPTAGAKPGERGAFSRMVAKAAAIDSRGYQYSWGGGHGQIGVPSRGTRTSRGGKIGVGYDCSGAVSAVLGAGGVLSTALTSGSLMRWGNEGPGKRVSVFADASHTIMKLGSRYFGTGEQNPDGGAGWLTGNTMAGRGAVRHPPRMRRGGLIPRFAGGGVVPGAALTGGVTRALTNTSGSLAALDTLIGDAADARIAALRRNIAQRVQAGGPDRIVRRLQAVLDVIDFELGRRVGTIQREVERTTANMDRARAATDRGLRQRGIAGDSVEGIRATRGTEMVNEIVMAQNRRALERALKGAQRAGQRDVAAEIRQQLVDLDESIAEAVTRRFETARDMVRAAAQERVDTATFGVDAAQAAATRGDVWQRLTRTTDTPGGMRERAGQITGALLPALAANRDALFQQATELASIGDQVGARQSWLAAINAANDMGAAMADAADLVRDAAMKTASELVDTAGHRTTMSDLGLQRLEVEQQLVGTRDTPGGAQGQASYIRGTIIPALEAEAAALREQQRVAVEQGDPILARQVAEALYAKETDRYRAEADARERIAAATEKTAAAMRELGGTGAFAVFGQGFTDLIASGTGA